MTKKVALVTGAAIGIGRAVAHELAKTGFDVVVNYNAHEQEARTLCAEIENTGRKAYPVHADLTRMEDLRAMFAFIDERGLQLDVLVNNAGVSESMPFLDVTEEHFNRITAVDWRGVFFCAQLAARRMIAAGKPGVIVNISSNHVEGCWPNSTVYAGAKSAVSKFTKNAAMELARTGIRVVAVEPGYTAVERLSTDEFDRAKEKLPLGRFATAEEIAHAVLYVISDKAAYMTGNILRIDGAATLPVVAENDFAD